MELPVDKHGHRLYVRYEEGSSDPTYFWVDEYGHEFNVPHDMIVPPKLCERCFARGEYTPAKVVHHIVWITPDNVDDPHITLSFDNFQRLCQDCHAAVHAKTEDTRFAFDDQGNLVRRELDARLL